jgi:DNA-binding NarL/FixJ family response regulator
MMKSASGIRVSPLQERYKVLIVDDHPIVRRGLAELLQLEPTLQVCGVASDQTSALAALTRHQPDLAVVDISLRGVSGLDLIRLLLQHRPKTAVLAYSVHDEAFYAERAFLAGAKGYLMKHEPVEELLKAIHQVLRGKRYLSASLTTHLADKYVNGQRLHTATTPLPLGPREFEVYQLLGKGRSTREIAAILSISIKTVESHYAHIREKLKLNTKTQLMQHATHWFCGYVNAQSPDSP